MKESSYLILEKKIIQKTFAPYSPSKCSPFYFTYLYPHLFHFYAAKDNYTLTLPGALPIYTIISFTFFSYLGQLHFTHLSAIYATISSTFLVNGYQLPCCFCLNGLKSYLSLAILTLGKTRCHKRAKSGLYIDSDGHEWFVLQKKMSFWIWWLHIMQIHFGISFMTNDSYRRLYVHACAASFYLICFLAYIKVAQSLPKLFKIAGYFLDMHCMLSNYEADLSLAQGLQFWSNKMTTNSLC